LEGDDLAIIEALSQPFLEELKNTMGILFLIADVPAEFRTEFLWNMNLECCRCASMLC
jgi:hypothetical protein